MPHVSLSGRERRQLVWFCDKQWEGVLMLHIGRRGRGSRSYISRSPLLLLLFLCVCASQAHGDRSDGHTRVVPSARPPIYYFRLPLEC